MLIRSAIAADVPAILALERASPSAAHWSQQQYEIAAGTPDRLTLVCEEDSAVEGFVVARILDREWEVENIVVARDRRRQGWGLRLLKEVRSCARLHEADAMFLEVRESNHAGRSLYEKGGFAQTGRRPRYYHDPQEDALTYHCIVR